MLLPPGGSGVELVLDADGGRDVRSHQEAADPMAGCWLLIAGSWQLAADISLLFNAVDLPSSNLTIDTTDGVRLEARWDLPNTPHAAVVFCHPHPQYGGTMHAPLMTRVTKELVGHGFAVLRFNFRGVGESTGTWGGGDAEITDVAAAMSTARSEGMQVHLSGWSFGAATSLRWQARTGDASRWVGIAPPVGLFELPTALEPAKRTIIIGDRDQFVTVAEVEAYGRSIGARVEVLSGSDHFFTFRHERVAEIMAETFNG